MKCDFRSASLVSDTEFKSSALLLEPFRKLLVKQFTETDYVHKEASIQLPFDEKMMVRVQKLAKTYSSKTLKYLVVIGIGGSNLGTQAIDEALPPPLTPPRAGGEPARILYLDTVSTHTFNNIFTTLKTCKSKEEFLLVSISKSGGTTETTANTEALISALKKPFGTVLNRLVIITGKDSKFWNAATSQNIPCLEIPEMVGGRYSVFSAVGLFPLALAGVDIKKLLAGAKEAVQDGTNQSLKTNIALSSAITSSVSYTKGHTIHNSFFFAPELESLGKWYRQLMAESLGKDGKGLMPIVSIGSTDMHSMAQLYYGGANNAITNVITAPIKGSVKVPKKLAFPGLVETIGGKSLEDIMNAISEGTKTAYKKLKRPIVTFEFEKLDAYELGYYLQTRMIEIMYLAKLMDVDAFDQPMVEAYKKETKVLLRK